MQTKIIDLDRTKLAETLKELRVEKGVSQERLGKMAELFQSHIWKYEQGVQEPRFKYINRITNVLGYKVEMVFTPLLEG